MNKELTQEEIAKVFAMYYGQQIIGVNSRGIVENTLFDPLAVKLMGDGQVKLILTPLSAISDEHSEELSEVFFPDGNIYDYLHGAPTGKAIVASIKANRQTNTFYPQARVHDGFEYLKMKGYAVPLFLSLNHWANGKTAIELGIAIDSTTLNTDKP